MKQSTKRSLLSILMSVILTLTMVSPAYAASAVSEEPIVISANDTGMVSPMYSNTPGFNAGYISGGYGQLTVTLGKHVSTGYFQAAVSNNKNSGTILVSVRYPNGSYVSLGFMSASGGNTTLKTAYGLSAGTYTFIFEPTSSATFNVQAYIYE